MRILDRYIVKTIIASTSLMSMVFACLEAFVFLSTEINHLGSGYYTFSKMVIYIACKIPASIYTLFPIVAFLGSIAGLSQLAKGSELTIMRASGLSILRITGSTLMAAIIMIVTMTLLGELVFSRVEQYAIHVRNKALHSQQLEHNIWLHHGGAFLYIEKVISNNQIKSLTKFDFNQHRLKQVIFANSATRQHNHWVMSGVSTLSMTPQQVIPKKEKSRPLNFNFTPKRLVPYDNDTLDGSIWYLHDIIYFRKHAGLTATLFQYEFWRRVLQPLTTVLMICLGVPFVFGSRRGKGASTKLILGVSVGVMYYFVSRIFGPISLVFQVPPMIAALLPTMIVGLIYLYFIRRLL